MATLLSAATGNFTSSSTWAVCDTTAALDSETGTGTVGNSAGTNTDSVAFAPGVVTVDGIAIKLNSVSASPSGTLTVILRNSTAGADVDSVVINVADLPVNATNSSGTAICNGWIFFKFSGTQLLLAATNYLVRCVTSVASMVTLYRDGTGSNWSRQLRTTTTAAPGAGDKLLISGELTGAGTGNNLTVTMDNTAATVWGAEAFLQSIVVSKRGTLTFGSTASTAYLLTTAGIILVATGGALNQGTSGTPIPSTSSAIIDFSVTTNVASGLKIHGGTYISNGATKTLITTITSDCASGQAVVNVASVTGWAATDDIILPGTTRTFSQFENRIILSIATLAVTVTANFTNLHVGSASALSATTPRGHVGNLTQNCKIRGADNTHRGFLYCNNQAVVTMRYTEMKWMGASGSYPTRGISMDQLGTIDIQFCSIWLYGTIRMEAAAWNNLTFSNNVCYTADTTAIQMPQTDTTGWTFDGNLVIGSGQNIGFSFVNAYSGTITNNISSGHDQAFVLSGASFTAVTGTFSGNEAYCNSSGGFFFASNFLHIAPGFTASTCKAWRNNGGGIVFGANSSLVINFSLISALCFGNQNHNISIPHVADNLLIRGLVANSDASFTTPRGITIGIAATVRLESCDFGQTTAHTSRDIGWDLTPYFQITALNCRYSTTPVIQAMLYPNNPPAGSFFRNQRYAQTAGDHRYQTVYGVGKTDTVIFHTASPSERMTPILAAPLHGMVSSSKIRAVANAGTVTASVWVRKSASGDAGGADYNGSQPRLIQKRNPALGLTADVVLDTVTVAVGNWEQLTGTTASVSDDGALEFYVDADGTAGWINVDDWTF